MNLYIQEFKNGNIRFFCILTMKEMTYNIYMVIVIKKRLSDINKTIEILEAFTQEYKSNT
jgi:hypothetical protein